MEAEHGSGSPKRLSLGFLISFMALLSKQASRFSNKLNKAKPTKTTKSTTINDKNKNKNKSTWTTTTRSTSLMSPRSPLRARPKQLITNISNKAITLMNKKKGGEEKNDDVLDDEFEFGDGGVWQRTILMGDKCQPLDFSGVIYYDSSGKKLSEVPPRSPRASPLPNYLLKKQEV